MDTLLTILRPYVLAVGICFNGISLPICLSFLPGHDITGFVEEIGIMERVVSLIGRERIECLVMINELLTVYPDF